MSESKEDIARKVRALAKEAKEQEERAPDFNLSTWWCAKVNAYNHVLVDVLGEKAED